MSSGTFDITGSSPTGEILRRTIVSQAAPPMPPPNPSASTSIAEHLHIFYHGCKATPVLPAPTWLQEKGKAVSNAAKGGLKARIPSLGVEVKVDIGDRVEIGLAIVMLESMKTETVLRADGAGSIKGIESAVVQGEMVGEGKELDEIEFDNVAVLPTIFRVEELRSCPSNVGIQVINELLESENHWHDIREIRVLLELSVRR
ncbi:hypothetical protein JB92DRAFT_3293550 [Gautieria morchelliformis]|nr:hypothetical protein JB92DRAFT_3293550 [Gautieria morchelliformis]